MNSNNNELLKEFDISELEQRVEFTVFCGGEEGCNPDPDLPAFCPEE